MSEYFCKEDEKLKWKTNSTRELLKTAVFTVVAQNETSAANSVTADFYIFNANDWVIVIPEQNEKFLMVKQWRHGENSLSIEFPGGIIDSGETPLKAAIRELKEETGCTAKKITKLGETNPNPALFSNKIHVFLAEDLEFSGSQSLDETEFINYLEIPKKEIFQNMCTPPYTHALMGTALMYYFAKKIKF